ncbi:MAG TPA: dienelactone hydrolase family protein [Polyangiales bacterium]|nr:dienelactone hydrolase family protein [Polyangiales bacterium]
MGQSEQLELHASDGGQISAYHVRPPASVRGRLVVVQEIFGVNAHIRRVADRFAEAGYEVIAPALFDRVERGVELDYDQAGIERGRTFIPKLGFDTPLLDIQAAIEKLGGVDARGLSGREQAKVGVVGYCWGGSLAFLSATRLTGVSAAVGYYAGQIAKFASEVPRAPTLLHFGEQDKGIPLSDVEAVRKARPDVEIELYPAQHGFNCDARGSFDAASAERALSRTLAFFERHLAG